MADQLAIQTVVVDPLGGSAGDGTTLNFVSGRGGDLIITQAHGGNYHQAYRGHTFCARSARAGNAIPVATVTTANTWGLHNPAGSGVNLEWLRADLITLTATEVVSAPVFSFIQGAALTTLLSVAANPPVVLAAGISNMLPGSGYQPKSQLFNGATAFTTLSQADLHAISIGSFEATTVAPNCSYDFGGMLIQPPGTLAVANALIAATGVAYLQVIYNEVLI